MRGAYGVRCKRGGSRAGLADVDADDVARQIAVAFLDDVAQMNADVELDSALSGQSRVAFDEAVLRLDGAVLRRRRY